MATFDTNEPYIGTVDELRDWCRGLRDELEYVLSNLDDDNMSPDFIDYIKKSLGETPKEERTVFSNAVGLSVGSVITLQPSKISGENVFIVTVDDNGILYDILCHRGNYGGIENKIIGHLTDNLRENTSTHKYYIDYINVEITVSGNNYTISRAEKTIFNLSDNLQSKINLTIRKIKIGG